MTADPAPLPAADTTAGPAGCPACQKPLSLCICDTIEPIDNRIALLVLQHPQEQDQELGTGRLAVLHLTNAAFRVGLSWASLGQALGRTVDPKRWAVLHLGAARGKALPPGRELLALDRKGEPLADQERAMAGIEGVVVLDGSWSQAKTLWWRNPWVLKCRRLVLNPKRPSLYGRLRREPRREGLSTLEAAALALSRLEGRPEIEERMLAGFARLLERYRR
jgi:DTW domain-containing protein YfiP